MILSSLQRLFDRTRGRYIGAVLCTITTAALSAYPGDSGCDEPLFHFEADYLYWKTQQDHLTVGSFVDDFPDPVFKTVFAKGITPDFKFDSGFRLHFDYQKACSPWQFNINFTYLPFQAKPVFFESTVLTDQHKQFIAFNAGSFPILTGISLVLSLLTEWSGHLSYVDADFKRTFDIANCFQLSPHIGFRAVWMDQKLYTEINSPEPFINNSTFLKTTMREQLQAYGVEAGLWGDWSIGYGVCAIGHVGGSLLYSNFDVKLQNKGYLGEGGDLVIQVDGKTKLHSATPTVDYFVGLQYKTDLENILMIAHIGWEQHLFFDFNQIATTGGNFSVQGLTAAASIFF